MNPNSEKNINNVDTTLHVDTTLNVNTTLKEKFNKNKKQNIIILAIIAFILVLAVTFLTIFLLIRPKAVVRQTVYQEINAVSVKINQADNPAERKMLFNDAEKIYFKLHASQANYSEEEKAIALAFYKYTKQKEVEDIDEETYKSLNTGITYQEALDLVEVFRKDFETLVKNSKIK